MRSQLGEQVLIIDAGGGTIDISTYTVLNNRPLQVEELYEPKCEPDQSLADFLFDSIRFRLGRRRRVGYNESNGEDQRCVSTSHLQTDQPTRNQGC